MLELTSIVNTYKAKRGIKFDKEVATDLGVKPASFSTYLKGMNEMPQILIAKIATTTGIPALDIMAAAHMTYKKTPAEEREFWNSLTETVRS